MTITSTTFIKAPLERVYELFTDFKDAEQRISAIAKIEFLEKDGRPEVGMKWRETRTMFGKEATEVMWISSITPNQGYVVDAESHGSKYRSEYRFEAKDGGTEVTMSFTATPVSLMTKIISPILFPVFKGATEKALRVDMDELKKVAEEQK